MDIPAAASLDVPSIQIVSWLLDAQGSISAREVAHGLNLTPRKVRLRLRSMEPWLGECGVQVESKPGAGYRLIAPQTVLLQLRKQLVNWKQVGGRYTPSERFHATILCLLQTAEPLKLLSLQNEFSVARTTVIHDLDRVQAWVDEWCLKLVRRRNYGFKIIGEEADIRRALAASLANAVGELRLLKIFGELETRLSTEYLVGVGIRKSPRELLQRLRLIEFNEQVCQIEDETDWIVSDEDHAGLVVRLAVQDLRLRTGHTLPAYGGETPILRDDLVGQRAGMAVTYLVKLHGPSLPDSEVASIVTMLSGMDRRRIAAIQAGSIPRTKEEERVSRITSLILQWSAQMLHPSLKMDHELRERLTAHLLSVRNAARVGQPVINPLLSEIKRVYTIQFRIISDIMRRVSAIEEISYNEHEIGYLTMHLTAALEELCKASSTVRVIVVCNAGAATTNLLVARIRSEFPTFEIVAKMSYLKYRKNAYLVPHDMVISSIPLQARNKPVIQVSPLLYDDDIKNIQAALRPTVRKPGLTMPRVQENQVSKTLADLLTSQTVRPMVTSKAWPEVVDAAGGPLVRIGAVEERYIEAMKQVVLDYGPFMVILPGVALLHARPDDGVVQVCMSLITLAEPVEFGHEKHDPVTVAIALGALDNASHLQALFELNNLLQDQRALSMIERTRYKSQILRIIATYSRQTASSVPVVSTDPLQ